MRAKRRTHGPQTLASIDEACHPLQNLLKPVLTCSFSRVVSVSLGREWMDDLIERS